MTLDKEVLFSTIQAIKVGKVLYKITDIGLKVCLVNLPHAKRQHPELLCFIIKTFVG